MLPCAAASEIADGRDDMLTSMDGERGKSRLAHLSGRPLIVANSDASGGISMQFVTADNYIQCSGGGCVRRLRVCLSAGVCVERAS